MGIIEYMLGLYRDDGKENGNNIGFRVSGYIDNGEENGNYIGLGLYWIMEKKMKTTIV